MSSFRIDRQYVAFETAETQPVFAANKVQKPADPPVKENSINTVDVSKLYDEIYERLQQEHAEQAEYMLSKASNEAQDILEKAKKQAEEIAFQARQDTERLREELKSEMEAAEAERISRVETGLKSLESKLQSDYTELVDEMRGKVVALVMEIVRKVIGVKLSQSDEIFVGMVTDALERLKQAGSVLIRVSPEDYARYFRSEREGLESGSVLEAFDAGEIKITAVEDPNFSQGDLIVESEGEMVDLSINRQIGLIENAFLS
jgi:flagellar biosynthesis/type III secretory pathway protein FliH